VEAHLLDFDRDLYSRCVALDFVARLRDEQRFPNVQALVQQIQADIQRARHILPFSNR
jgi:riboflavin kinase/FMN adenylyltransferase